MRRYTKHNDYFNKQCTSTCISTEYGYLCTVSDSFDVHLVIETFPLRGKQMRPRFIAAGYLRQFRKIL